jgi:hypothetical protein
MITQLKDLQSVNVAVVGSRDFADPLLMAQVLDRWLVQWKNPSIVTGTYPSEDGRHNQTGADQLAVLYAREHKIPYMVFEADWKKQGKAAGMIRNTPIVTSSDVLVAFWDMQSKGTRDSLMKARRFKKPIILINLLDLSEQVEPKFL